MSALELWFVHGLGDWSRLWRNVVTQPVLSSSYRLVAPDLPGYGLNEEQPRSLEDIARWLGDKIRNESDNPVVLVGHSMGATMGLLLAEDPPPEMVGFIDVEGPLHEPDVFIANRAMAADRFEEWFDNFRAKVRKNGGEDEESAVYADALDHCNREAFRQNSADTVRLVTGDAYAQRYLALTIPRLYVMSARPSRSTTLDFLLANELAVEVFEGGGHQFMARDPQRFASVIHQWCQTTFPDVAR